MKKKELMKIRKLRATGEIMALAAADVPEKVGGYWRGTPCQRYQNGLYLRCEVQSGILHAAIYLTEYLRMGSRKAAFDLYIDREQHQFLTCQCETGKWLAAKLDMLPWPFYVHCSEGKWISGKDYELIRQYLKGQQGGFPGLLEYQLQVRKEELHRKYRRQTERWDADLSQTPKLPKDWDRWVYKTGIQGNFIFYRYVRRGADHGYCTWCEAEVPIRNPRHNRAGRCPVCRHRIVYKALGKFRAVNAREDSVYLMQRCKDGVMIRVFSAGVTYSSEEPGRPEKFCFEKRRILYNREGRWMRNYYYGVYKQQYSRWIEGDEPSPYYGYYYYHDGKGPVYGRTIPDLARNELRKTGLKEYLHFQKKADPEDYLEKLERLPELERIAKGGLTRLAEEYMNNPGQRSLFREEETSLGKMLGINTMELKRLREHNGGFRFLKWLRYEKGTGKLLSDENISWFCAEQINPEDLKFIRDRMSEVQIFHYMKRQMKESGMTGREILAVWRDYLSMAVGLGMDRNDPIVYRCRKLRQRHDDLVKRSGDKELLIRMGEILEKFPETETVLKSLKGIYDYADDTYSIVIPSSFGEILQEGRKLHHCVGDSDIYWDRINRRESYILFLRKTSDLQSAWYTLEVEPDGTVRQKRTAYNRQGKELEQIEAFLKKWQNKLAEKLTDREKVLAGNSSVLRKANLAELKENQVVIRLGEEKGKLLAEVLEQDLMEAA